MQAHAARLTEEERNTIQVFKEASASVVYITSSEYRRNFLTLESVESRRGAGTGIVWDKKGHILTNYHVVQGADKLRVTIGDAEAVDATLIGGSAGYDIAVLKVDPDASPLVPLKRGDSDSLLVGNTVLAIGNPFGFNTSLSRGVVSALGREISTRGGIIRNAIQTDAAINPGNSGGPLLNSEGEVVGMNVLIYSPSGASAGIGFSIPVNTLKRIAPKLIQYGRVPRAFLGIEYRHDSWARHLGVKSGVPVVRVIPGTPAHRAGMQGIQAGRNRFRLRDIIVAIGDAPVESSKDIQRILENYRAGEKTRITVMRNTGRHHYELNFDRD
jgi:S1-C subfamily serine protease